jgi:hypothetical protein
MTETQTKIVDTIIRHVRELLDENAASIFQTLSEIPDGKLGVGFKVALDWSSPPRPKVKTGITYARNWKDEREDELDDPNQISLPGLTVGGGTVTLEFKRNGNGDEPGDVGPMIDKEVESVVNTDAEPEPEPKPKRGRRKATVVE